MRTAMIAGLLLVVLLTACGGPRPVERYVGTDGLLISFEPNAPPDKVYEGTSFPVRLVVRNAGATDLAYDRFLLTFNTDPLYVSGGVSPYLPQQQDPSPTGSPKTVYGKSLGYPSGDVVVFSTPIEYAFGANQVLGQRVQPETTINAGVCYAYTTHYSASVCIDTNAYQENLREQPCEAEDLAPTGGQGAPIAVTGVKVQGFPIIDRDLGIEMTRPYFTFTIENVGKGQIVGPDDLPLQSACLLQGIPKEQLGAVRISAYLINNKLECQPDGLVRLVDGKGEVRCTVSANDLADPLYASAQNYRSTIILNLTYLYKDTTQTKLEIERVPGAQITPPSQYGEVTGYQYATLSAEPITVKLPIDPTPKTTVIDSAGHQWSVTIVGTETPATAGDGAKVELIPIGHSASVAEIPGGVLRDESGVEWRISSTAEPDVVSIAPASISALPIAERTVDTQLLPTGPVVTNAGGVEVRVLATPDGEPVTNCELYANNPDRIPASQAQLRNVLTPEWSCGCSQTRCATLSRSGQCITGLCPGTSYCCLDTGVTSITTTSHITVDQLLAIVPQLSRAKAETYVPMINIGMDESDINTPKRQAAYLAQLAHESAGLTIFREIWGPTEQQLKYDPPGSLAKSLGNTQPGDGYKYRGRGPIQLTGRSNYRQAGAALNLPLEEQPELVENPAVGFRTAAWYWKKHNLNTLADQGNFAGITKVINGCSGVDPVACPYTKLAERQAYYTKGLDVLA